MCDSMSAEIKPNWDLIEELQNKNIEFLKSKGLAEDIIDTLTMVIGELLENAIKYGEFIRDTDEILFTLKIKDHNVIIEVKNPIRQGDDVNLIKLDKTIQWIRGYQNPFEAYVEKLKQVSGKPLEDMESGIGLARIAYEGQSILDFYVGENDIISVSAIYSI